MDILFFFKSQIFLSESMAKGIVKLHSKKLQQKIIYQKYMKIYGQPLAKVRAHQNSD